MRDFVEKSADRLLCDRCRLGQILSVFSVFTVVALVSGPFAEANADKDALPSLSGDWTIKIGEVQRKLTIVQDQQRLSGVATKPDGKRSFELSGTIDKNKTVTVRLFWDYNEVGATKGDTKTFSPEVLKAASKDAFDAALKERADAAHPTLLPEQGDVVLQYEEKEESDQVFEALTGGVILPVPDYEPDDAGKFKKLKKIDDQALKASVTRDYAARCAAEMGTIPAFSCLNGKPLKITVSGVEKNVSVAKCDNPIELPLDDKADSQCVPGSYLVLLPRSSDHPTVRTVAICRKYKGSLAPEIFNDIAMVSHDEATGNTCFFQSPPGVSESYDGRTIPSPTDKDKASTVWGKRAPDSDRGRFGPAGVRCNACHSPGPFVWSPYVGQAVNVDEALSQWDPNGKYHSNFSNIFGQTSKLLTTKESNACALCHRLGDGDNCRVHSTEYVKQAHTHGTKEGFWMPPPSSNFTLTERDFDDEYGAAMAQLGRCCDDPSLAECQTRDATPENTGGGPAPVRPIRRDR